MVPLIDFQDIDVIPSLKHYKTGTDWDRLSFQMNN